jgi:hypothetical protein
MLWQTTIEAWSDRKNRTKSHSMSTLVFARCCEPLDCSTTDRTLFSARAARLSNQRVYKKAFKLCRHCISFYAWRGSLINRAKTPHLKTDDDIVITQGERYEIVPPTTDYSRETEFLLSNLTSSSRTTIHYNIRPKYQTASQLCPESCRATIESNRIGPGQGLIRTNQIRVENSSIRTNLARIRKYRTNSTDLKRGLLGLKWLAQSLI